MSVPFPAYPAAAPAFPQPQQFQQPAYPQPFPAQPQQFAAPQYPMMPQGAPAQPRPPLPTGTLDDFYGQPSAGGGPAIKLETIGQSIVGQVARDVTSADVQAQTDMNTGAPRYYRDGRPMFMMIVPLQVQPSAEHPEGVAALYVRGQLRDELQRAMTAVGAEGAPKAGDLIQVTLSGTRASRKPGFQPSKQYSVQYSRPGATPASPSPAPAPAQQVPAPAPEPLAQPAAAPQVPQFPAPVAQPVAAAQPADQQPPALAGMTAEQQALFARLSGGQA